MGGKSLIEKGGKKISLNIWYEGRTQLAILLLGDQAIVGFFFFFTIPLAFQSQEPPVQKV